MPERFYEVTFDLQPDDQIIPAGERITLMIFSSDRDFTLWPAPGDGKLPKSLATGNLVGPRGLVEGFSRPPYDDAI